jgi:broad specificity phosphatase PhoE
MGAGKRGTPLGAGARRLRDVGELILVRHGETEWSRDGRHTGRTDMPLLEAGRRQAALLREPLASRAFDRVLASPRRRALDTCRLAGLGDRVEIDDDLAEWDYGEYEGITTPQIREQRPDWVLWRDGCPGGESPAEVGARADRVLGELEGTAGDVALFSHGHFLRVLAARWVGLEPSAGSKLALTVATLSVLGFEHRVDRVIGAWNAPIEGFAG